VGIISEIVMLHFHQANFFRLQAMGTVSARQRCVGFPGLGAPHFVPAACSFYRAIFSLLSYLVAVPRDQVYWTARSTKGAITLPDPNALRLCSSACLTTS